MSNKINRALSFLMLADAGFGFWLLAGVNAQTASCYDLWRARNAIYAAKGYCFNDENQV